MSSGVEFEEDSFSYKKPGQQGQPSFGRASPGGYGGPGFGAQNEPGMVRFLMRHGLAKSPAVAQGILIGVVIVDLIITYIIVKYFL